MWTNAQFRTTSRGLNRAGGFTLLELAAVAAIVAILASLLCAALNHTKAKALRITCMDNLRQLQFAWRMYNEDNDGLMALNKTAPAPNKPQIFGRRLSTNSWAAGNPLEDLSTANIKRGTLYSHTGNPAIYRCPMDDSTVTGHPDVPRNRSYSMNAYLGGDNAGSDSRVKLRYSELIHPDNVFVFIEEHQSSIWGTSFMVLPPSDLTASSTSSWVSTPSDRHYQGCNLSFADDHVEYWRWYAPKGTKSDNQLSSTARELRDVRRLQSCIPQ